MTPKLLTVQAYCIPKALEPVPPSPPLPLFADPPSPPSPPEPYNLPEAPISITSAVPESQVPVFKAQ
jgi:hypothetical protein